ncbi:hypothetical protein EWM64_g7523 [Hericium alpestre]|uniref:Uncharacterized protein n=1 Tax=Hericium alpestre TaxID=135208 RepID=A0A4Y9ZRR1_9AGAM|nr:hypothetical protein EWM64_g7523 [Hericium alpestre]
MSPEDRVCITIRTIFEGDNRHWRTILARALIRPLELFITEPIVQLFGVYMAFVYDLLSLPPRPLPRFLTVPELVFITTLPSIFQKTYHESLGISGLHYIALGGELFAATQVGARMMDRLYAKLSAKNGGIGKPEFRAADDVPWDSAAPGRPAHHGLERAEPCGIALVGAGVTFNVPSMQTYIIDAFSLYAASGAYILALL